MVVSKLQKARQAQQATQNPNAAQIAWIVVSVIGFGPALGVVLVCLVGVIVLTGSSGLSSGADPSASGSPVDGSAYIAAMTGGDGKAALKESEVPDPELVEPLKEAAKECDLLGPVVLAAQIEVESQWDASRVGPDGEQGLAQLPPAVFTKYGKDDDKNGKISALDAKDAIFAQARYLCALGDEIKKLLDDRKVIGDRLTLTLLAWDYGVDAVKEAGGVAMPSMDSYPMLVRTLFKKYEDDGKEASAAPSGKVTAAGVTEAQFQQMFPSRSTFYSYAGLTAAMGKFPTFAAVGDDAARRREIAAFLANVDAESGGLLYVEEIDKAAWGNYCDGGQPYGCPAGRTAYHGRGPLQLSWNTNYKAAGDALGLDLLNDPDQVKNNASVAWQTALWFWMTQSGAGTTTPHAAITGGGFGETIRSINGALECGGRNPGRVQARVTAYQRFTEVLGVAPGDNLSC
ncbi:glycoside hydrolase family 19 protein [Actinoplanes sp. NPDC049599]|uniref:glycoside hydrolase family 19 protein n=1 Tax=Actinoplanes sp. NPDC049599 TaxID=3363903 RepID=UPI00379FDCBD